MNTRAIYWTIGIISSISVFFVLVFYLFHFTGNFADKQSDWGAFGDYVGGLVNPLIGFLNLAILIYISDLVAKSDEEMRARDMERQRQHALYSLRNDALKEMQVLLAEIEKFHSDSDPNNAGFVTLGYMRLESFFNANVHLYPFLEHQKIKTLSAHSREINKASQELSKFIDQQYSNELQDAMSQYTGFWETYLEEKNKLIRKMQDYFL